MTIITNWYTLDGKEGVDLNNPQTINTTTNPEYPKASHSNLDRIPGIMGSEWVFVQASTTVTANNGIVIDNLGKANNITSALVASNVYSYGIAEFQASAAQPNDYFWALLKANGGVAVNISPSVGRGVQMYISAVAGSFTSSVTSDAILNIELVASIGTSASGPGEAVIRGYMIAALNMAVAGATV